MSIYKRGKIWWIRFTAPNGQRIFETTRTKDRLAAQELHDKRKTEYWRVHLLKEKPKYTWEQAVVRWLKEQQFKRSLNDDKHHLRKLDESLRGIVLVEINRTLIDKITQSRLNDRVKPATVNRMLEVLRAILRRAERQWEWIDRAPHVRMLKEPKRRIRWITCAEFHRLLVELPDHLATMSAFSVVTGLRESNVTGLTWSQVDIDRKMAWIHPDQSKSGKAIPIPLSNEAVAILKDESGKHEKHVFAYNGKPVTRANNHAWRKALIRAGITDFRWHDLRHTWASWHVQAGTPLNVLQELGGWESPDMVRRYAHLSASHLASFAGNISSPHKQSDTPMIQREGDSK